MKSHKQKKDADEVKVFFRSVIEPHYYGELERIFYFNMNQSRYAERITRSVKEYDKPCIIRDIDGIRLAFRNPDLGQTLHIFDTDKENASIIGVLMFVRDNREQVTLVHLALHEKCSAIFRVEGVNITMVVFKELVRLLRKMNGVEHIRLYYNQKIIKLK